MCKKSIVLLLIKCQNKAQGFRNSKAVYCVYIWLPWISFLLQNDCNKKVINQNINGCFIFWDIPVTLFWEPCQAAAAFSCRLLSSLPVEGPWKCSALLGRRNLCMTTTQKPSTDRKVGWVTKYPESQKWFRAFFIAVNNKMMLGKHVFFKKIKMKGMLWTESQVWKLQFPGTFKARAIITANLYGGVNWITW